MTTPYDDIIHMPHPDPKRHPRMSASDRAAQFSPFAALTTHSGDDGSADLSIQEIPDQVGDDGDID